MTPVEALRAAAAKLRETGAKATPGPWYVVGQPWNNGDPYVVAGCEDPDGGIFVADMSSIVQSDEPRARLDADAAWMALASPMIAEPLAVWLEFIAETWAFQRQTARGHALAVARAVLGEPTS